MWFLEKVAIISIAQFIMISRANTKPHTFINNQAKGNNKNTPKNYLTSVQAGDIKNSDTNSESILKAFNFHDVEYPVAATPRPQQYYFQDFNEQSPQNFIPDASNIKIKSDLKPARNGTFNNFQKFAKPNMKSNSNKLNDLPDLPKEFRSGSDYRNVVNFPEVEYPLSAKETWKPNYWSIPSESKDLNVLKAKDSLNQNIGKKYPTRNLGVNNKSEKCRSFSIKSYSDIMKNKEQLKQILENKANTNKQNNSTCPNDFIINCEKNIDTNDIQTLPIENTDQELYTTVMPYYFTPMDISECDELKIDLSNSFSVFNTSNQYNYSSINYQNDFIPNIIKTDNPFIDNNVSNLGEISAILLKHNYSGQKDVCLNDVQEMNYDPYDIIDVRKPEVGDLCGLDEDYTTDVYSEEKNSGWFSHPISTPPPNGATTVDLTWKNCKTITPCEFNVDELEDYYISV